MSSYRKRTRGHHTAPPNPSHRVSYAPSEPPPINPDIHPDTLNLNHNKLNVKINLMMCLGMILLIGVGCLVVASKTHIIKMAQAIELAIHKEFDPELSNSLSSSLPQDLLDQKPPHYKTTQPTGKSQTELYQNSRSAVVMIYAGAAQGSGVIADGKGVIITNEHVVRGQTTVEIKTTWGKTYKGKVNQINAQADLAVVSISEPQDRTFPCLGFATAGAEIGQPIYALSNPLGMESTFTNGMVSRIENNGDILHTAAIAPGSSGSPLIDASGKVIAINKAVRRDLAVSIATPAIAVSNLAPQSNCTP